jgi:hypothetical protein
LFHFVKLLRLTPATREIADLPKGDSPTEPG